MLELYLKEDCIEVGIDEAGRGCYAGPVVAAAVIWSNEVVGELDGYIKDSKKLSATKRYQLAEYIRENAVDWSVTFVNNHVIDQKNILNATYQAMHESLDKLIVPFDHIIVDGNRFKKYKNIDHTCIIKGDDKYISIAAASILAKESRDEYMKQLANYDEYKIYKWHKNFGYGTQEHRDAITIFGLTDMHRKSFNI